MFFGSSVNATGNHIQEENSVDASDIRLNEVPHISSHPSPFQVTGCVFIILFDYTYFYEATKCGEEFMCNEYFFNVSDENKGD